MSNSPEPQLLAHFVGGLRRPARIGTVNYSWPLIGLYVYADHFEFGPGFKFMRRVSRPVRVFTREEVELVGPTNHGIRFTFTDGQRWIFGRSDVEGVLEAMARQGVRVTRDVVPARWLPPL